MNSDGDIGSVWALVLASMREEVSETTLNLWFGDLSLARLDEHSAVLLGKSNFKCNIVRTRYADFVGEKLAAVLGFPVTVYVFSEENGGVPENFELLSPESDGRPPEELPVESEHKDPSFVFSDGDHPVPLMTNFYNTAYTFENFIVGNSNKFAYAASMAVASDSSADYNPLFIYGHSGLGKTHLLYAITNEVLRKYPEKKIVYVKSEEFINQLIEAFSKKETVAFRDKYRTADVLLLDDVQFLAGKEALQEELFHTFNALHDAHKQIILTSDRPPRDIKTLEERLRTRFEWGLIVDVQPPDFELRIAILKAKSASLGFSVPNDVLSFLADKLQDNVRQIEGVIKKMGAQSFLSGSPISMETARAAVVDLISGTEPANITIEKILAAVSKKYNVSIDEIKGRRRTKEIARARHVAVFLIKRLTDIPLTNIARVFERDHTTIMASVDVMEREIADNPASELEVNELIKEIK